MPMGEMPEVWQANHSRIVVIEWQREAEMDIMEMPIMDLEAESAEENPHHDLVQRFIREQCELLQATWTKSEERRRRTRIVEPLEIEIIEIGE